MQETVRVVVAEVSEGDRYLITQRSEGSVFGGLWEFPGGRVRSGESDRDALSRALLERLGVEVEVGDCVEESQHTYAPHHIVLAVYRCALRGEPSPLRVASLAWVAVEDLDRYSFPPADSASIARLLGEDDA